MTELEKYKKANLETLIPTTIWLKDKSKKVVMIPKKELWYEADDFSGHRTTGFAFDKLQNALDSRNIDYKFASYKFI